MELIIIKKVTWKNVYLVLLDENYNVIEKENLLFDNKIAKKEINLAQAK